MAVIPAAMAESIIILDDDEEENPIHSSSTAASSSSSKYPTNHITTSKIQQPTPTHITQSPFASAKKEGHVLQAENQRLFTEFVEYCSALTQDCPEVMTFLHTKHAKASPEFLRSVEFRNTLGRCLTRAQARRSKTFVYINELCTVLRQHSAKRRQSLARAEPKPSTSTAASAFPTPASDRTMEKSEIREEIDDELPSTSGLQEVKEEKKEAEEEEKKTKRASKRQIAYLENLLKVYNDEIHRLQEKELSVDDLMAEDSGYIQEHKLKRKMMKIYDKLCELKGCSTLTGRVIEQRIPYTGTRYPEINRKIERFINSPEAQFNPPDYSDILRHIRVANDRHSLSLSRKQMNQIAGDIFRDTGTRLQERRHLDMVYNFGSHLTDPYKPTMDPALSDQALARKLCSNRELALSSLEEVISKYALKQDDTEEEERRKRQEKDRQKKEGQTSEQQDEAVKQDEKEEENGEVEKIVGEEPAEEEEDEEDDVSSDPDIEEELQASEQQVGPEENDDEHDNEVEQANGTQHEKNSGNKLSGDERGDEEGNMEEEDDKDRITNGISPMSDMENPGISPIAADLSSVDSPSQSETTNLEKEKQSSNDGLTTKAEAIVSSNHVLDVSMRTSEFTQDTSEPSPAARMVSLPPSPVEMTDNGTCCIQIHDVRSNSSSPSHPSPRTTQSRKRKRGELESPVLLNGNTTHCTKSEVDIPLDMGVECSSPRQDESTRPETPTQNLVTSSQSTPPPKKNKVNVSTQCDPDEIIVLSDSD